MTWQRIARWVVAAIGIGCAIAIAVSSRRREPPPPRPPALKEIDKTTKLEGGAGRTQQYRVGKSPIITDYNKMRSYDDGRSHFEDVIINGLDGQRYTVRAKVMETSAPVEGTERPARLNLSGNVKLTTDDGLEVLSDTATWEDATNQLTMPGKVTFKKGRVSGSGDGATYERERDAFTLLEHAQAHVEPDADGKGVMDLSSATMTLVRGQHIVILQDNARIVGEAQTLTSKAATMSFTEDEKAVKYLELRGSARVTPNPAKGATTNRPGMNADNITMSFYEDGVTLKHATQTGKSVLTMTGATSRTIAASWIDLNTAPDGQTLTDLQAKDKVIVTIPPTDTTGGRTITAASMVGKGDPQKGLTSARFDGSPVFEETAPAPPARRGAPPPVMKPVRRGSSVILVLTLDGQIDAIQSADFQQNAEFKDSDTVAKADNARFEEASGLLKLTPNAAGPRQVSHVETPDMSVYAVTINVNTQSNDLDAHGAVSTTSKPTAGGATAPGALFSGDGPIIGSSETLVFTKTTSTAVYTGTAKSPARLRQTDSQSVVSAGVIEYTDTTRNLKANGAVDSTWQFESEGSKPGATEQKTQQVQADKLVYDETKRTAVYTGTLVHVTTFDDAGGKNEIEGKTVIFRLEDQSRELRQMTAQTAVWAKLSGGYEALGDVLVYDAKTDTYTLEGRQGPGPATVKAPPSEGSAPNALCQFHTGMRLLLNRKDGQVTVPGEGQAPKTVIQQSCTISLRPHK